MSKILIQLLLNASPVIMAAIFHMVVVKKNWLSWMTYPMDHFKMHKEQRILGPNKTYRGLFIMVVASICFTWIYFILTKHSPFFQIHNLLIIKPLYFIGYGFLYGIGYILGELPNSFYKRQQGVQSGKSSRFFMHLLDQIDSVLVIMLFLVAFSDFTWLHFSIGIFFYGFIHIAINYILYLLGLRKEPF